MHIDIPLQTYFDENKERAYLVGQFQAVQLVENNLKERMEKHVISAMRERGLSEICFSEIDTDFVSPPLLSEEGEHAIVLYAINIAADGTIEVASSDEDGFKSSLQQLPCNVAIDVLNTFEEIVNAYDNSEYEVDETGSLVPVEK